MRRKSTQPELPLSNVLLKGLARIPKDWLSPDEVAEVLDLAPNTVRNLCKSPTTRGKTSPIPHSKVGSTIRIPRQQFIAWLNANSVGLVYDDPGYDPDYSNLFQVIGSLLNDPADPELLAAVKALKERITAKGKADLIPAFYSDPSGNQIPL